MSKRSGWIVLSALLCASAPAAGDTKAPIVIDGAGITQTQACAGGDVVVNGAGHNLTFTGECGSVTVNGSGNVVAVEAARKIVANGTNNQVTWARGAGKLKKPKIGKSGLGNKVVKGAVAAAPAGDATAGVGTVSADGGSVVVVGAKNGSRVVVVDKAAAPAPTPAPAAGAISVVDNHQKIVRACAGADVSVAGNYNHLVLSGECGRVVLSGNYNKVELDGAAEVSTPGNFNTASWKRGAGKAAAPKLSNQGNSNTLGAAK